LKRRLRGAAASKLIRRGNAPLKFLRRRADEVVYVKKLNVGRLSEERLGEAERELEVAEAFGRGSLEKRRR